MFFDGKKILFTVVLPDNATKDDIFAKDEIEYAVEKCTGCKIATATESDYNGNNALFIGKTAQAKELFVNYDYDKLSVDGYVVKSIGNDIYVYSVGSEGVIYGAYTLLNKLFGTEFIAYNEYVLPRCNKVSFDEIFIEKKPDIETRVRSLAYSKYDNTTERRYGFNCGDGRHWVTWAHTHFLLIPKNKFFDEHPDFYSRDGMQLCLSNELLPQVMAQSILERLTDKEFEKSDILYVMVGHEDYPSFCDCDKCRENAKKYGGNSGIMMRFINRVADIVTENVSKTHPDKVVKIITFAYGPTLDAPAIKQSDGTYVVADLSVVAHRNVGVMFAPLEADWAHSLTDTEHNAQMSAALLGWKTVQAELFVWTYDCVFDDCFVFLDNWTHLSESYRTFKECGASYIFDQGDPGVNYPFSELRNYIRGKLMWDLSADQEQLIKHFIKHYYKQASNVVEKYFYSLREHFAEIEKRFENKGKVYKLTSYRGTQPYYHSTEFWDKEFLVNSLQQLTDCWKSLEFDGRNGSKNRLELEMLSPMYLLLELYGQELSQQQIKDYIAFFERVTEYNGIYTASQCSYIFGHTIYNKFLRWRCYLNEEQ